MRKYHIFDALTDLFLPAILKNDIRMAHILAHGSRVIKLDYVASKSNSKGGPIGGGNLESNGQRIDFAAVGGML
jgi:hypothetical protein